MRWIRGIANAMLMATLVKPVVRFMVGRWRKRARESVPTAISLPVQQLIETALVEELSLSGDELKTPPAGTLEDPAGSGAFRRVIVAGSVLVAIAVLVAVIATTIRRRREAREAQAEGRDRVAIPVEVPTEKTEEAEEAVAHGTRPE